MRFAAPVRRTLGIRSIFNVLGPICNPAPVNTQLLGVYDPSLTEIMANALKELGCKYAMVVHGHGGLDEVSLSGPTKASWLIDNKIKNLVITPEDLGVETSSIDMLAGGDAKTNAEIVKSILTGERKGPRKDMVLINAAVLLYACKKADTLKKGVLMAQETIDSGAALEKLIELIRFSNILGKEDA
jgi:anthranilate phosphoribosyltransferase